MAQTCNGKPGDLIEISRGSYQHWAVYIGENEVVHLVREGGKSSGSSANPGSISGMVKREKFADVVGNDSYRVNNLLDNSRKPCEPSIIVKEACAKVGCKLQYDLVTYNCEHFATTIRYGEAESLQVTIPSLIAIIAGTAVALVTGGLVVAVGVAVVGAFTLCAVLIRSRSSS